MAAAQELSRAGWDVAVVERKRRPLPSRAETLPGAARPVLERLGVAAAVESGGHPRVGTRRSCWGSPDARERPALLDPYGEGWHIDRPRFDAPLKAAAEAAGAAWIGGSVQEVQPLNQRCFRLVLGGVGKGWILTARGVVDATGRGAQVARRLGARQQRSNRLVAACATAAPAGGAIERTGLVEAAEAGWWYSAPLANDNYAVQFITLAQLWSRDRSLSGHLRSAECTARRIDRETIGAPVLTVADSVRLDRCAGPGWVAAGDAATAHDPLAAAGLTMALRGGLRAAQALASWLRDGHTDDLETYDQMQRTAFDRYLRERTRLYSSERRWSQCPFWAQQDPNR
jgi:flavin-dependent dehydrogenase